MSLFSATIYEKKWAGLCYDGQRDGGRRIENVPLKDCQEMCTMDLSCVAFASNPSNICWITGINETVSKAVETSNRNAACYKKVKGKRAHMLANKLVGKMNKTLSEMNIDIMFFYILQQSQ